MQPASLSPGGRDGSVREFLFFPVFERNEQERLEAMMRRSLERSQQLEQRPKRWSWGWRARGRGMRLVGLEEQRQRAEDESERIEQGCERLS